MIDPNYNTTQSLVDILNPKLMEIGLPGIGVMNIGRIGTVSVSSYHSDCSSPEKAIDGIIERYCSAWVTNQEVEDGWIQVSFPNERIVYSVVLYNLPSSYSSHILSGRIVFSDNTSILVSELPDDESPLPVNF